jgi:hypothetical protein
MSGCRWPTWCGHVALEGSAQFDAMSKFFAE